LITIYGNIIDCSFCLLSLPYDHYCSNTKPTLHAQKPPYGSPVAFSRMICIYNICRKYKMYAYSIEKSRQRVSMHFNFADNVRTVEPVRSDTWVFRHPVTSDKNYRSQNISLTFFVKKPWVFRHLSLPTSDTVLWSQCY